MKNLRRIAGFLTAILLIPLALVGGLLLFVQTGPGRGLVVWAAETFVSGDGTELRIGGLSGRLPFDMTVTGVTMADTNGVWLDVDRARLAWRPFSLAAGVLSIEMIDVDNVEIARLPQSEASEDSGGGLPVLPFEIVLDRLSVGKVALAEPVIGAPAAVTIEGDARLGDPSDGLSMRLDVERIDGTAGRIAVNLGYRPDDEFLDLDVSVDEPEDGLVARLTDLPGVPPLHLDVSGTGPIDNWAASIDLRAADRGAATGTATVKRQALDGGGTGRALSVDLTGELAGLLQPAYAPLAEGRTTLSARVDFPSEGAVVIRTLEILTAGGWVSVNGTYDPDTASAALSYEVVAGEARRFAAILPVAASWQGIELTGRLDHTPSASDLITRLIGEGLAVDGNTVAALDLSVTARTQGPFDDPQTPINLTAEGNASGLVPADATYSRAAGEAARLTLNGVATRAGRFEADPVRLVLGAGEVVWSGVVDQAGFDGDLVARNVDLANFAGLSDLDLRGIAALSADVSGRFDRSVISATVDGGVEGFASGIPQLDGALGERFTITGGAERNADGSFAFNDLNLSGAALKVVADGSADLRRANVTADISLPDLEKLDPRVSGAAEATARLTGSLEDLALQASAAIDEATAMGRPIAGLKLSVDASDITGTPEGSLSLAGKVDDRQIDGSGRLSPREGGGLSVEGLDLVVGSVRVAGDVSIDGENRAEGRVVVKAADLGDLSSFALTELKGSVDATVALAIENGVQVVEASAKAEGVEAFDARIGSADLNATVRDPAGTLVVDADVTGRALDVGGQRIDDLKLTAQGGADENSSTLEASGLGASVNAGGAVALVDGDATIRLASMTLSGGGQTGTLAAPATIKVAGGGVAIQGFSLTTGGGGIDIDGSAGEALDLKVAIRALPLSLADIAVPGTGLSGTLSGDVDVTGAAAAPSGAYTLQVSGLALPAMTQAGIGSADISASGRLADGRTTVDARVTSEGGAALDISGSAPLSATGALDIGVKGRFDLALIDDLLAASGDRVAGPVDIDMKVTGAASSPDASGTIRLTNGSYSSPLNGVSLDQITMEARGGLKQIEITRFSARTPNNGGIAGSGTVGLDPGAGFPVNVRLDADNAEIISNELVDATIDAALRLTGPAATGPSLGGTVTIRQMDITLPDRLPSSVTPIPVEHINTPPALQAQFREEDALRPQGGGGDYAVSLDVKVGTTNRIFVRGMGVDAQLGGEITVRGTSVRPIVVGGFELRRGYVDVIGQRIEFTRGIVTFPGTDEIDPELDLVAETRTSSITARVTISGPASRPTISFSSSPELPEDEVLAHILFDKATGQLSPGEAIQLAQAAARLAGIGGSGSGLVDKIRKNLGLDVLQLTTSGDDPAIGIGRYINDNIYVGVKQGVRAESSRVTVDIDVTDNIRARGEVGADGSSSVGINLEWDY